MSELGFDPARELIGAAVIGAGFLAIFGLAELWKRLAGPPSEWTRKFVHFFGGLIAASLPWVLQTVWSVVALALVFLVIIWGSRRLGLLGSVHGVERESQGGIYYPLAVLVVFVVGHDRPVFYLVAILALVVSDTLAALVGSVYGRQPYAVETDRRSIEGSAVFLLTTFLVTHLPLLLLAELDPLVSVLVAVKVAIIVTQFEAISLKGADNFLVPVATFFVLHKLTPYDAEYIAGQLVAQLVIIAVIGLVAWRAWGLTFSGAMALMLFVYGLYSLGGPEWVVAPGIGLLGFIAVRELFATQVRTPPGQYQVIATFYVCIVPTVLLFANNILETMIPGLAPALSTGDPLYVPYVGIVAAHLALLGMGQLQPFRSLTPTRARMTGRSLAGAILLVVPAGLAVGPDGITAWGLVLGSAVAAAATGLYILGRRLPAWPHVAPWNVRLQAASTAVAATVAVPLHFWWLGALG